MQRKLFKSALCSVAAGMLLVAGSSPSSAAPVKWFDGFGANGHYYEIRGATLADTPAGTNNAANKTPAAAQAEALLDASISGHRATLVTITSQLEQNFVNALAAFGPAATGAWIGVDDSATEGTYVWVPVTLGTATPASEAFSYTNWASGEPDNNVAGEDFVRVATNGEWADFTSGNRHYILEWSPIPEPGSMVLSGLGVLAMAGYGWRRRRNKAKADS